jgi:hypothetical protein
MNQISDQFKIKDSDINTLMLCEPFDDKNDLQNIKLFTDIIIKICFNIQQPENWRFIYDNIADLLKIKIDGKIEDASDSLLNTICTLYKEVINYEDLDPDVKKFYIKYIDNYENDEYKKKDKQKFIKHCYKILEDQYMKLIDIIDARLKGKPKKETIQLEKIIEFKLLNFGKEKLDKLYTSDVADKIYEISHANVDENLKYKYRSLKYTNKDIITIDLFIYLLELIYNTKKENKTIKYDGKSFTTHYDTEWDEKSYPNLLPSIFNTFHNFIENNNINIKLIYGVTDDFIRSEYKIKYDDECVSNNKNYRLLIRYYYEDNKFLNHNENLIT